MIGILPKLTREYILDRITQEAILARFLGISIHIIYECITKNKLIRSPLRADKNPTCGFLVKADNRITFNDFAGYFTGDCFDVVGYQNCINADDKVGFNKILHIVAKEFKIHEYTTVGSSGLISVKNFNKPREFTLINILTRDWNYADRCYWDRFNINLDILNYYQVFPVQVAYLNNNTIYHYFENDPCYAYYLGTTTEGEHWKLYFPRRKQYKFITNSNKVQGTKQVVKADTGIITKSLKDVMSLYSFGITAVAVPAESVILTPIQIAYLRSIWGNIYSLMDFDYAGIKLAVQLRKQNIPALFFTNGKFETYDYKAKDFSEHVDKHGIKRTQNLIDYIKSEGFYQFNNRDFSDFQQYNYE